MPIIIISSDLAEAELQIAEKTAVALNYQRLGPEVIPEIAARHDVSPENLTETLETTPSPWRLGHSKRWLQRLAFIEADVLDRLKADNMVCWGLGAHLYVQGVSHALKVRLLTDAEQQAQQVAQDHDIPMKRAQKWIESEKRKKEQWSMAAFGQNELEPSMYDLVINLGQIDPDEAVSTITSAVAYRKFQPMTYSVKSLAENALAAKVKAKLLATMSDVQVEARDDRVIVTSKALKREKQKKAATIKEIAGSVEGVEFVEVHLINYVIREAAESFR